MMILLRTTLIGFFLFPAGIQAQAGMNSNWIFGMYTGVTFNSGSPVPLSGSTLSCLEGSASISDASGQLLFYTDGVTVKDKNHVTMPNGTNLFGNISSTQSAIICPDPGATGHYYIFTCDQGGYISPNLGIHYSIVDMTLNGGNGDVIIKNQFVAGPPMTEKMVAVRHCNGRDFWIIVHKYNSDEFQAYKLTPDGIDPQPVISTIGTSHNEVLPVDYVETIGNLKASPDGKKLGICASAPLNFAEIFDFDNQSGVITNPITFDYSNLEILVTDFCYGISFSPDNSKFYVGWAGPTSYVFQYDVSLGNPSAIIASQVAVAASPYTEMGSFQIAPDGKIYINAGYYLHVINNPDIGGIACNCQINAVTLSAGFSLGLPNIIDAYESPGGSISLGPDVLTCASGYILTSQLPGPYLWSTGETTSSITVNQSGIYWVDVQSSYCQALLTDTIEITFLDEGFSLGPDMISCDSFIVLTCPVPGAEYLWNSGQTTQSIIVYASGDYSVTVGNGFCSASDEIHVDLYNAGGEKYPNVFTPNGDLVNDVFDPGDFSADGYALWIYNRYGQPLFHTTEPSIKWTGKFNGKEASEGVYYWVIYHSDCLGNHTASSGFVELIR